MLDEKAIREIISDLDRELDADSHEGTGPFSLGRAAFLLILGGDESAETAIKRQRESCLENPGACAIHREDIVSGDEKLAQFRERLEAWFREELKRLQTNPGVLWNVTQLSFCLILFPGVDERQLRAVSDCMEVYKDQVIIEYYPFLMLDTGDPQLTETNKKWLNTLETWMHERENCLRCGILCSRDGNGFAVPMESRLQIPLLTLCMYTRRTRANERGDPHIHLQECLGLPGDDVSCFYTARTAVITANRKLITWERMQTVLTSLLDMEGEPERLKDELSAAMGEYRQQLWERLPREEGAAIGCVSAAPLWGVMNGSNYESRMKRLINESYIAPIREVQKNADVEKEKLLQKIVQRAVRGLHPFRDWEMMTAEQNVQSVEGLRLLSPRPKDPDDILKKHFKSLESTLKNICAKFLENSLSGSDQRVADAKRWLETARAEMGQRCETQKRIFLTVNMSDIPGMLWEGNANKASQSGLIKGLKKSLEELFTPPGDKTDAEKLRAALRSCIRCVIADVEDSADIVRRFEEAAVADNTARTYAGTIQDNCREPVRLRGEKKDPLQKRDILLSPQEESNLLTRGWGETEKANAINLQCRENEIRLIRYFFPLSSEDMVV